ncbi:protein-disulfide reductase DsbD family protein [Caulobacter sp. NIBR2454]|uniref:protein-disulfide reductase DsbD family protein n=1 Tax=Caulobacter sp. NIBR2454 TaxID=3015996 RepID=UPI0022B70988|nr:thioredoxin family protein [Caulobacter sp. NIBR2454]
MIARLSRLLGALGVALGLSLAAPALAAPVNTGHIEADLVARDSWAVPGSTIYVAVTQKIDKGWHTYWRNSGDSGEATSIDWTLPAGWTAGDIVWATPHRQPTGPLMNYGYADKVVLPVPINVPVSAKPGETVTLKADVLFLVCADICIPENAKLELAVEVRDEAPEPNWRTGRLVADALTAAPKSAGLDAVFQASEAGLKLAVTGAPLKGGQFPEAYFFPFDGTLIDHAGKQTVEAGPDGVTLTIPAGVALKSGQIPEDVGGVLSIGDQAFEIVAKAGTMPAAAAGMGVPAAKAPSGGGGGSDGVALAILFAFVGGLILNLMPCVFPVLSMKAASLAGHAQDPREARTQGLAFLAGVLVTFLALAGALIAARAAGQAVGWGFQLQSPAVVGVLSLVMLLTALNLSSVFEVGTSVQGAGQGLASKNGLAGSFFTGVLAVVVAAPCTAPFMAPAIGVALTQPAIGSLAIFLFLGLGLAAPYVAISFSPALLRRFPRPGPWMDVLKKVLAFPMYGAAAWLVWVFSLQAGSPGLALLLACALVVAFAAWLFGLSQRQATPRLRWMAGGAAVLTAVAVIAVMIPLAKGGAAPSAGSVTSEVASAELASEPWSPERVAALRAEGRPVFVNFTAAWCVTCQVNDKVALSTQPVADAFKTANAVYMVADWTNRNAEIAQTLAEHGRAGVPLYLVYGAKGGEAVILPQLLTPGAVTEAIEAAALR